MKKRAVVTGGTRGIGLEIARQLHEAGLEVLVTGTRPESQTDKSFLYHAVDFSSLPDLETFVKFLQDFNADILINNAGINKINDFAEISSQDFLRIQQVNSVAPFHLCQAVLPHMKKQQWGRIVNITSIWSKVSKRGRGAYSTSKCALDGLSMALAAEVAQDNVLVNCVSPGFIDTELTQATLGEAGIQAITEQIPMKRLGKPQEIAAFVVWLVSEANTYISGQNLVIDGGFTRV